MAAARSFGHDARMQARRLYSNLALIGFMATGKSSVGRLVARRLGYAFVDTDTIIEKRAGRPIAQIFAEEGEARFRLYEREVVQELKFRTSLVIATGGGLAVDPANLNSLKEHALVVCLWASHRTIWERACRNTHRPLLQTSDPEGRIRDLLLARVPFYRKADVLVCSDGRSVHTVATQVYLQYQLAHGVAKSAYA